MSKREKIREELEEIAANAENGRLNPKEIVEFAADPKTALHSKFTWDDAEAGHTYRIQQARVVAARYRVVVESKGGGNQEVRAFVSLVSDRADGGGYRTTLAVMTDAEQRRELLGQALAELERLQRKYQHLSELVGVFEAASVARTHYAGEAQEAVGL